MSQLTIQLSAKADALIAQLQKEIFNRRRKKVSAAGVIETLVESGAKSQSDKRFATSWTNLVADIEKAARVAEAHGAKPSTLSDEEWAMVLSHRSRSSTPAATPAKPAGATRSRSASATARRAASPKVKKAASTSTRTSRSSRSKAVAAIVPAPEPSDTAAIAKTSSRTRATGKAKASTASARPVKVSSRTVRASAAQTAGTRAKAKPPSTAKRTASKASRPASKGKAAQADGQASGSVVVPDTSAAEASIPAPASRGRRKSAAKTPVARPSGARSSAARRMAKAVGRLGTVSSGSSAGATPPPHPSASEAPAPVLIGVYGHQEGQPGE